MNHFRKEIKGIVAFLHEAEKLKTVLRHSWLSSGRRESVAEHTWRMAMMAMVFYPSLRKKPDLLKVLKMILVHDLAEIYAGDDWAWQKKKIDKRDRESKALEKIVRPLSHPVQTELMQLWNEFEDKKTREAKFAAALDKLEVVIQHMEGPIRRLNKKEYKFNLGYGKTLSAHEEILSGFQSLMDVEWIKHYKKHNIPSNLYT